MDNNCKFTRVLGIMRNYGSDFSGAGIVIYAAGKKSGRRGKSGKRTGK